MKLDVFIYTAFMKACASSPALLEPAHAAFKRMIWGPRRMKPSQVCMELLMLTATCIVLQDLHESNDAWYPSVVPAHSDRHESCVEIGRCIGHRL